MTAIDTSIIIPANNEEAWLGRCLEALLAQDAQAGAVEIVVVGNACTDGTVALARSFVPAAEGSGHLTGEAGQRSAALSFPLSATALGCLAAAVVLAWSMTRSRPADEGERQIASRQSETADRKSQA